MAKKRIAVLGAGIYNIRVYEKLREAGYYTLAIDGNEAAPAGKYADEFAAVNFSDENILLEFIQNNPVDGIMPVNDWGTKSAAYVSEKMGLLGISPQAALNATDKGYMRDRWKEAGLPNPPYFVFSNLEALKNKIHSIGFPCVVKPTDSKA